MARKKTPAPKESSSDEEQEQQQLEQEEVSEEPSEEVSEEDDEEVEEEEVEEEEVEEEEAEEEEEEEEVEEEDDDDDDDDEEEEEEEEKEEEDEGLNREAIRKLLEPFGKDQLLEILKQAAKEDPSIATRITRTASSDPIHRKIFVRGLGWDATTQILRSAFETYGPIEECNLVTDKVNGRSKGYGFVLFATPAGARKALKNPHKRIGNRVAACQLASTGPAQTQTAAPEPMGRKIFVSNIGSHINPEKLKIFFSKFGEIEEGPLGYDRNTGKLKGFALFTYKTPEGCRKALEEPSKLFEGCQLHCQPGIDGMSWRQKQLTGQVGTGSALQPNDLALTYAPAAASLMGLNPVVGQNLNPGPGLMGQSPALVGQNFNPGTRLMGQNPLLVAQNLNPGMGLVGQNPAFRASISPSLLPQATANQSVLMSSSAFGAAGLGGAFGGQSGINSISPSVMSNYGSQAALQGLGVYQSSQLGQSPSSALGAARTPSGLGSMGGLSSYLRR